MDAKRLVETTLGATTAASSLRPSAPAPDAGLVAANPSGLLPLTVIKPLLQTRIGDEEKDHGSGSQVSVGNIFLF